jgi:hypothetical protein
MFIDNLHIVYLAFPPLETNLPLIVDSDRVPVRGIGRAIGSPDPIVLHRLGAVKCPQLAQSDPLNLFRDLSGSLAAENLFRFSGFERFDHEDILTDETTRTWTTLMQICKRPTPATQAGDSVAALIFPPPSSTSDRNGLDNSDDDSRRDRRDCNKNSPPA